MTERNDTMMFKEQFYISKLIAGYFRGKLAGQEKKDLDMWIAGSEANAAFFQEFENEAGLMIELKRYNTLNEKATWLKAVSRIKKYEIRESRSLSNSLSLIYRMTAIAAVLGIILCCIWFFKPMLQPEQDASFSYANDVAAGNTGATLTLSNGKKIKLSDVLTGEIARESGVNVIKKADGQLVYVIKPSSAGRVSKHEMNTLSTAPGETYMLTLPDQSKVWLNAASSLSYSANLLDHGIRKVKLQGEAYFEIFKDQSHPFMVESRGQKIAVLGTHFNVEAYSDDFFVKTTLLEGAVRINKTDNGGEGVLERILQPGEQAALKGGAIAVVRVNAENAAAWKNGDFVFEEESLESILRKVSRWYNVEVIYSQEVSKNVTLGGIVSRSRNLSAILKMIELTKRVRFKIEGRKVYVNKFN